MPRTKLQIEVSPFHAEVLAIRRKILETTDPDERGDLILKLAQVFDEHYDPADQDFSEQFHHIVDTYHQAFLAYNQAALRLGRVLMHAMEEKLPEDEEAPFRVSLTNRVDRSAN